MAKTELLYPTDSVKKFLKAFPTDMEIDKQLRKCLKDLIKNELPDSKPYGDVERPRHSLGDIEVTGFFNRKGHLLKITARRFDDTKELIVEDQNITTLNGLASFKFDWKGRKTLAEAIDEHGFFKETEQKPVDRTKIPLKLYEVTLEPLSFGFTSAVIACESQELLQGLLASHVFKQEGSDRVEYRQPFWTSEYLPNGIPSEEPKVQCVHSIKYVCDCSITSAKEAVVVHSGGYKE
jgi:hypothetical protein